MLSGIWSGPSTKSLTFLLYVRLNIVCYLLSHCSKASEMVCERVNGSRCKFHCDSGDDIDISKLDSDPHQLRFTSINDSDNTAITYMWNPCMKFSFTSNCTSVNVCQIDAIKEVANNFGDEGPILSFDTLKKQYFLSYLGPQKLSFGKRETNVYLEYKGTSVGQTSQMSRTGNYLRMTLFTKYAPHRRKSSGPNDGGSQSLSIGTVLLIIFFSILFVYLTTGMAFMKCRRGAQGKEVIPHYSLWSEIPSLAKDGCVYTIKMIQKCASPLTRSRGYEEI